MNSAHAVTPYSDAPPDRETPSPRVRRIGRALRVAWRWGIAVLAVVGVVAAVLRYRATHAVPLLHFDTAPVDRGPIAAKVTATGAVSALVTVSVGSQVSGRIEKLFVDFGSTVRRGQTVATIDPAFFRAAVAQARANYLSAKAAVD